MLWNFRFPFYYEVKILLLIWLISPVSKGSLGSSIIYRRFVHPNLIVREEEIDRMICKLQEQGYNTVTRLAVKAFNYISNMVMQTAIRVSLTFYIWCGLFLIDLRIASHDLGDCNLTFDVKLAFLSHVCVFLFCFFF